MQTYPSIIRGNLLNIISYNPGAQTTVNTASGIFSDVDAVNLVIPFIAPSSGNVLVFLSGLALCSANNSLAWNLRNSGGDIAGTSMQVLYTDSGNPEVGIRRSIRVTGLVPGSSQSFKWGHARIGGSGSCNTRMGGAAGQANMEVWEIP